jgi:hypothetical protein
MNANKALKSASSAMLTLILSGLALTGLMSTGCDQLDRAATAVSAGQPANAGKEVERSWPIIFYRH